MDNDMKSYQTISYISNKYNKNLIIIGDYIIIIRLLIGLTLIMKI